MTRDYRRKVGIAAALTVIIKEMNPYLFPGLEFGPKTIRLLLEKIDPRRYDEKLDPSRFSLRESIAHLADWEPILRGRITTSNESPGATLVGLDEGQLAIENRYSATDPIEQAKLLESERAKTIAYLKTLSVDDWNNFGVHNERGKQTVYDQANLFLGHDLYHIEQISQYLGEKTASTW